MKLNCVTTQRRVPTENWNCRRSSLILQWQSRESIRLYGRACQHRDAHAAAATTAATTATTKYHHCRCCHYRNVQLPHEQLARKHRCEFCPHVTCNCWLVIVSVSTAFTGRLWSTRLMRTDSGNSRWVSLSRRRDAALWSIRFAPSYMSVYHVHRTAWCSATTIERAGWT